MRRSSQRFLAFVIAGLSAPVAAGSLRAQQAGTASTHVVQRADTLGATFIPAARQAGRQPTVFSPDAARSEVATRQSLNLRERASAVRPGEYRASPFLSVPGGPAGAGALGEAAEAPGISVSEGHRPLQYLETVFVHLPGGAAAKAGDQYIVFRLDSVIEGRAQVVVPTGIVTLTAAAADGRVRARIVQKFEEIYEGQGVTPLDTLRPQPGVYPAAVESGLVTHLTWINFSPVLPGSGAYVALAAGSNEGLVPGDQFSLLRSRGLDAWGAALPDEEVAVAQVMRVTPYGAAAIILRTLHSGVVEGMKARLTGKMP